MSDKTENLRFVMYRQLEAMRKARKQPAALQDFENKLEDYLVGLSVDHTSLVASLQNTLQVYQDAYENQKTLTRNACVYDRERYDELYQLRADLKSAEHDREEGHDKLQRATAKLDSAARMLRELHRVIKNQNDAYARLQALLQSQLDERNQQQAEAHRQIMAAEAIADDHWEQLEQKQETIISQRKRIDELQNSLLSAMKPAKKPSFWLFWMRKSTKAKILPKKTH